MAAASAVVVGNFCDLLLDSMGLEAFLDRDTGTSPVWSRILDVVSTLWSAILLGFPTGDLDLDLDLSPGPSKRLGLDVTPSPGTEIEFLASLLSSGSPAADGDNIRFRNLLLGLVLTVGDFEFDFSLGSSKSLGSDITPSGGTDIAFLLC